jgi:hypothetical protein
MISKIKKAHNNEESIKSYFVFDPLTREPGVNIEDKTWINYVNKRNKQRSNQKKPSVKTKVQPTEPEQLDTVNKNAFAKAVIDAAREQLGMSNKDLKRFMGLIEVKYEGMG